MAGAPGGDRARDEELVDASAARRTLQELGRERQAASLRLIPLSRAETILLTRSFSRVGSDAQTRTRLEEQVWRVSEGNPFVAVETIRALQEGSTLESPTRLSLPQRVHDLIAGRLERLSGRARQLAAVAAVIGEEFDFPLLLRALGLDEAATAEGVEEVVRRRVLQGSGERLDFVHDRIRTVVYGQLLPAERKRLHRRVGEALETLFAGNLEPHHLALGLHFREGDVWDKAVAFLRDAGARAAARCASREAVACFEGALDALSHLPESSETTRQAVDLRLDLQTGYILLGELPRRLECLREAEALATRLDDERRLARVSCHLAVCFWWTGELESAVEYSQRALTIARKLPDASLQILARARLGLAYLALGEYRRAVDTIGENMKAMRGDLARGRFGMASLPAVTDRSYLGICLASLGDFTGAAAADDAVEIAEAADHPYSVAMAYFGAGRWRAVRGDFHQAIPWLERALDFCRREGFYAFSVIAGWTGLAYAYCGRLAEGVELLEDSVEREQALGFMPDRPRTLALLGEAYLMAGRLEDALRSAREAISRGHAGKQRGYEAMAWRLLGDIHARRDPAEASEAVRAFGQALALAEALGMRPLIARCHLGLGTLCRRMGKRADARRELETAADLLRSMGMTLWLEQAEAELAAL